MINIELLIRYTTWFGTLQDAIVPIIFVLNFSFLFCWNRLSAQLLGDSINSNLQDDYNQTANQSFDQLPTTISLAKVSKHSNPSSPSFSARFSRIIQSISLRYNRLFRWLLIGFAILFAVSNYIVIQETAPRILYIVKPMTISTIVCTLIQVFVSGHIGSIFPRKWLTFSIFLKIRLFISHLLSTIRLTPKNIYHIQVAISVISLCLISLVFLNNEPLTRKVPNLKIPTKLCPAFHSNGSRIHNPSQPFELRFKEYVKFHAEVLSRPQKDQRILLFHAANEGLGNRLEGLVSSFLLAMLTNRALVVNWKASSKCGARLPDLFEPPFEWHTTTNNALEIPETRSQTFYYSYCKACPIRTRRKEVTDYWENLLCDKDAAFDPDARIVHISSTQWFAAALQLNPHMRSKICDFTGPDIFGTIAKQLLKLNPEMKRRLEDFKRQHHWMDSAQSRMITLKSQMKSYGYDNLNQCGDSKPCQMTLDDERDANQAAQFQVISLQIRRLEGFGVSDEDALAFLRCATSISRDDRTRYFLATDHVPTRRILQGLVGEDRLLHVNSTFDRASVSGIQDALLELYLLGEADEMIMSPYSTYGDVAHARTSIVPYKVGRDGQCTKLLSSQPCFFYYFGLFDMKCWNDDMLVAEMTNQENCYL